MATLKLTGKELRALGYPESPVISIAMNLMHKHYKHQDKTVALDILKKVLEAPAEYANDEVLGCYRYSFINQSIPRGR